MQILVIILLYTILLILIMFHGWIINFKIYIPSQICSVFLLQWKKYSEKCVSEPWYTQCSYFYNAFSDVHNPRSPVMFFNRGYRTPNHVIWNRTSIRTKLIDVGIAQIQGLLGMNCNENSQHRNHLNTLLFKKRGAPWGTFEWKI